MIKAAKGSAKFDMPAGTDIAWCPGCGNFPILFALKAALSDLGKDPSELVLVSGIGQAAKLPQYLKTNYFNGLHGRALPAATGIKAANPSLSVVVTSGDGDVYGEGGNHLIHTIRRNPDITVLVHDNMIYGLTQGQASPTSEKGMVTPVQPQGVFVEPINAPALAISLDAPFVARASVTDGEHLREIIKEALSHPGFSLVDVFQPCVVFNKVNTYRWFEENTYRLEDHDPSDRERAFALAVKEGKYPLGVLYKTNKRKTFEESIGVYDRDRRALFLREQDRHEKISALLRERL
ncbi:MAG TPA: 2-oxoacid ferredoxin oxidoreductase [Candidatus Moranbacteria bacterium]|nr:2-oxoacid ferredoxin oxidoreductase [Candidatus Moranbacteria bacterium]